MMEVFQIKQARMESKIRRTLSEFRETKHSLILPAISSCWLSSRNTRRWSSLSLVGKQLDWIFIPLVTAPMFQTSPKTNHKSGGFLQPNSFGRLDQPLQDLTIKWSDSWGGIATVEIHWEFIPWLLALRLFRHILMLSGNVRNVKLLPFFWRFVKTSGR